MNFACVGADGVQETSKGMVAARCRNQVQDFGQTCPEHKNFTLETAAPVLRPHLVLLKVRINRNWREKFREAGVRIGFKTHERSQQLQQKHQAEAENLGRDFHAYRRPKGDSGSAVMNPLSEVDLVNIIDELLNAGYSGSEIHIEDLEKDEMSQLIVSFRKEEGGQDAIFQDNLFGTFMEMFSEASWDHVHLYANPPKYDGTIVHTINCAHRKPGVRAHRTLQFTDGLWNVQAL